MGHVVEGDGQCRRRLGGPTEPSLYRGDTGGVLYVCHWWIICTRPDSLLGSRRVHKLVSYLSVINKPDRRIRSRTWQQFRPMFKNTTAGWCLSW